MFAETSTHMDKGEVLTKELPLGENEFTMSELLAYFRAAYGRKENGTDFTVYDIINWIRLKKLPECYGGNKVRAYRASGIRIVVLTRLEREDVKAVKEMVKRDKKPRPAPTKKPIKKRTALYYQLAKIVPPSSGHVLPDNYKALGIKNNQFGNSTVGFRKKKK